MTNWKAKARGKIAEYQIKQKELAEKMNVSEQWVSDVLNGYRSAKDSESKFMTAIGEIIKERNTANEAK